MTTIRNSSLIMVHADLDSGPTRLQQAQAVLQPSFSIPGPGSTIPDNHG
jgi:hypothetical protein